MLRQTVWQNVHVGSDVQNESTHDIDVKNVVLGNTFTNSFT
jgi:hypothetical protein